MTINDMMLFTKGVRKLPDDHRMIQILEVLDMDKDGKIDVDEIRKVNLVYLPVIIPGSYMTTLHFFGENGILMKFNMAIQNFSQTMKYRIKHLFFIK